MEGIRDLEKFRQTLAKLGTAKWSSQNKIAITSSTRVGDELLLPTNSLKIMNEDAVITQEGGVTRSQGWRATKTPSLKEQQTESRQFPRLYK